MGKASKVLSPADILKARETVREVYMDEKIEQYIVDLVYATLPISSLLHLCARKRPQ